MDLTRTAFGTWGGGRYMNFGEAIDENRYINLVRLAFEKGIRTFITADVYGAGQADEILGRALEIFPRDSYCLVGAVGHDIYRGKREGAKGYPRFTDPSLRGPAEYRDYLKMATEKILERTRAKKLDCLLLHNPDSIGYTSEAVWKGMESVRDSGLTELIGIAPGPANGFSLDLIQNFEKFGGLLDWAMIILNPLEPWPGNLCLGAAEKHQIKLLTRVVDYGGLFYDDVKPGHKFLPQDHRAFRPAGWVEEGNRKLEPMRRIAKAHGLTMLQLACVWNLSHSPVKSVVPTLIQEPGGRPIEEKVEELARVPDGVLPAREVQEIFEIGNNKGCMSLKGGNPEHQGDVLPDRWPLSPQLADVGRRWGINPEADLIFTHKA